ncbi:MAG: hypothetical protein ACE5FA_01315 [Dehalococcoidia bacterium]
MIGGAIGGAFGKSQSAGAFPAMQVQKSKAALKAKEKQASKQAATMVAASKRNAAAKKLAGDKGGTLLTGAMGISDQQLNLGKTKLGA